MLATHPHLKLENVWQAKDLQTCFLDVWQGKDLRARNSDVWQIDDLTKNRPRELDQCGGKQSRKCGLFLGSSVNSEKRTYRRVFWMCGKERTYGREFRKCGRQRSYGILTCERGVVRCREAYRKRRANHTWIVSQQLSGSQAKSTCRMRSRPHFHGPDPKR